MATKTLGIKFEIAGVKEAQAGLNSLRNKLNLSIKENKQAIDAVVKFNSDLVSSSKARTTAVEKANQNIFFSYLGLRANIKRETNKILVDTETAIKRSQRRIGNSLKDYLTENFGSKGQKQQLYIRQESQDLRGRQTNAKLSVDNKAMVLEFRLAYREFFNRFEDIVEELKPEKEGITSRISNLVSSPLKFSVDALLFPLQSAFAGAFERFGEMQTEDFSTGFNKSFQKSLGLPFEEVGGDVGTIFGQGLNRTYETILKHSKKAIVSDIDSQSDNIVDFFNDIKKIFTGALIQSLAIPVKAHKRIQLRTKAVPKAKSAIGDRNIERELSQSEIDGIKGQKSITILTGGVNMDPTAGNTDFAERLFRHYVDDTYVTSVKNTWSNQATGKEYNDVLMSMIRKIIDNPMAKSAIEKQLNEKGLIDDINKQNKKLGKPEIDTSDLVESIFKLIQSEELPLVKLLETAYEGYNVDDINIAAEAAFFKEKFPDMPVNLVGTSAGGFNAAGALEILEQLGYTDIKAAGITTPNTGIEFTGNPENYFSSIGTQDEMYKGLNEGIFDGSLTVPEWMQVVPKAGRGHLLPTYMGNPEFRARFAEFFTGRMTLKPGVNPAQMGFVSRIAQDPQYGDILRTFQGALGEDVDDGYQFNADDLQGFKDYDLKKKIAKAKKGGSPEIIKLAEQYEDFIDTLIDELKRGVKPLESLKKATKFYPELNELAKKEDARLELGSSPQVVRQTSVKPDLDTKDIVSAYNKQLALIIERSAKKARDAIKNNAANLDSTTAYEAIRKKIVQYRKAVTDGAFQTARKVGEELLEESEYLKQILGDTDSSKKSQLSRIQNEILSGDKGKGRSQVGLANLPYSAGGKQLELDFESIGKNSTAGFDAGAKGKNSGKKLADDIVEGTEEGLDINSPSEVFKWIGLQVKRGFELGVRGIFGSVEDELTGVDEVVGESGFNEIIDNFFGDGLGNIKNFFDDLEQSFPILGRLRSALIGAFGFGLQAFGLYSLSEVLGDVVRGSLDAARGIESLDQSILASSGNLRQGFKNFKFVRDEARRLEIDLNAAKESYKGLLGSTQDTSLQGFGTEQIFTAFSETAKNRSYTPEETSRIFAAVSQSIGKGKLQSEEIVGQLSEVMGDIQGLISNALGIDRTQLPAMISDGVEATDVWLKVAAQLNAQNAKLSGSTQSATAAMTNYRNAALELKAAFGQKLQPAQKLGLNLFADQMDYLRQRIDIVTKVLSSLSVTIGVNLVLAFVGSRTAIVLFGAGLDFILKVIAASLPKIAIFLRRFIAISIAIEVWTNVLKLSRNEYVDALKDIENLTLGVNKLSDAFDDATNAQQQLNSGNGKMELQEGWELPENWFGNMLRPIVGGDRLNLDNLIRKRIGITTQAERKQYDFLAASGETRFRSGNVLNDKIRIRGSIDELNSLDAERQAIISARNTLVPGDAVGYRKSLEKEKEILEQRDKVLKQTSQYQQNLDTGIQALKRRLDELAELDLQGGSYDERKTRATERTNLLNSIDELEDEKKAVAKELSLLKRALSGFERELRNTSERVAGFNENQDRITSIERAEIINSGLEDYSGDRVIQLELDDLSRRDLQTRIANLDSEISKLEKDIKRPHLAPGAARINEQLAEQNIPLNEDSLQRIIEESSVEQDRDAAKALLELRRFEAERNQYNEQLAQNLQTNRTTLIDFNRTIDDYFFNLNQQIQEAIVEIQRIVEQIIQTQIRNRLQSALSPNANSFVNSLISSTQSMLDQAASYAERVLGQRNARIQFAGQKRSLQYELNDFARNVRSAGDALVEFEKKVRGAASDNPKSSNSNNPTSTNTTQSKNTLPVPSLPRFTSSGNLPAPPPIIIQAEQAKDLLVEKQQQKLVLTDAQIAEEKKGLEINIDNAIAIDRRRVEQEIIDKQKQLESSLFADLNLVAQYDYQTADSEAVKNIRTVNQAFSDRWREISQQMLFFTDEILSLNKIIDDTPELVKLAKTDEKRNALYSQYANAKLLLPIYQNNLNSLIEQEKQTLEQAETALEFVTAQNELKKQAEKLNLRQLTNNQKLSIAQARGTLAQRRQLQLKNEELRLESAINDLQQKHKPGEKLNALIKGERATSQVNTENIDYDSQIAEFDLEKRLLDSQGQIDNKNAGFMSRIGDVFGADKLKKKGAIASENLRFRRQLVQINKDFAGQPDLIDSFTQNAIELNRVNLDSIENEFRSLGKTVEDIAISSFQGFMKNFVVDGLVDVSGDKDRQLLEEKLRYAEELNQLNEQYADDEVRLAHLKDRAKEVNEQKLDKIKEEFNGFKRVINIAKQALLEFGKQLAAAIAQAAAAKIIGSIVGGAVGGANAPRTETGRNDVVVSPFIADEGATVGENIKSRKIGNLATNYLRRTFPGVAAAWKAEGKDAQLGVFHTNEELISDKTGEAPAYRGLKRIFGANPAQQIIKNFSDGGTVGFDAGANILSGFPTLASQAFDLSSIDGRRQKADGRGNKTVNISQTIYSPDADSFNANADQRNQDLIESLARGV